MPDQVTCSIPDRETLAERYVSRTLDADNLERFESHFVTCAQCQDSIALVVSVRAAMRGMARITPLPLAPPRIAPDQARRRMRVITTAGALLAAGVVGIAAIRWNDVRATQALGARFTPPVYGGVAVRGPADPADSIFSIAMRAYAHHDYAATAHLLRLIAGRGAAPSPSFFLGASLFMLHDPAGADSAFARVIADAPNPYVREAEYYRAIARLQLGERVAARRRLQELATEPDSIGLLARSVLAQLEGRRTP